jgi:CheY-like chemotaxis protein
MSAPAQVLIVDDEAAVANGLARLIERRGHGVAVALSAKQALEAVANGLPPVILLDLNLDGGRSGWEVWGEIRGLYPDVPTRLYIHSAAMADEDRRQATAVGAAGLLRKSTPPRRLVETICASLEA